MTCMKCKIGVASVALIVSLTFITNFLTLLVTRNCFPFIPTASLIALGFVVGVTIARLYIGSPCQCKKQQPMNTRYDDSWKDTETYVDGLTISEEES